MIEYIIAFDVDGTLRNNNVTDRVVANERIRTLLIILSSFKNVKIVVWSGGGELYARQMVEALGIHKYVDDCADKKYISCEEAKCKDKNEDHHHFDNDLKPDIAIDDIQECELGVFNLIVREK